MGKIVSTILMASIMMFGTLSGVYNIPAQAIPSDGTVKSEQKISDTQGGFTGILGNNDQFGVTVANIGDLDGDGVTDLAVGVLFDDDGSSNRGAVWILFMNGNSSASSPQPSEGIWTEVFPSPNPGARSSSAWAFDSINNVFVLFGGVPGTSETWIYDLTTETWEQKFPVLSPPSRSVHTMTFDSKNGVVVLFGGYRTSHSDELDDTWVYDVGTNTWRELNPPVKPPQRHWPGLAYDKNNEVVVLFGGHDNIVIEEPVEIINDTWILDVANETWTQQFPAQSPSARQTDLIYNEQDGLIYAFGGKYELHDDNIPGSPRVVIFLNDLWKYDVLTNNWSVVHNNSTLIDVPEIRRTRWTYDTTNNVAVLFGGQTTNGMRLSDTWLYDFNGDVWTEVTPTNSPVNRNLINYDPINNMTLLYGGRSSSTNTLDDFWKLQLTSGFGFGPSFLANGTNFLDEPDKPDLRLQEFSLASWFKTSHNAVGANSMIVNKGGFGAGENMNYGLYLNWEERLKTGFEATDNTNHFVTSPNSYNDDNPHYAVVTYDLSILKLYVNGSIVASLSTTAIPDDGSSRPVRVGANSAAEDEFFNGSIDEVRIWNRPLTDQEVSDQYNSALFDTAGQILYQNMGEPSGNNPPVSNNQTVSTAVNASLAITLTASDADGDPLTFSIVDNPSNATLSIITPINATAAQVTYTPNTDFNGTDSFTFKANDGINDSNIATVDVIVNGSNIPPVADAGPDQTVDQESIVTLDGTGSFDSDGDPITYSWTQTAGPHVTLSSADIANPTFRAPGE